MHDLRQVIWIAESQFVGVDKQWYPAVYTGTVSSHLWWNMMEANVRKRMYVYVWLGHFAV